MQCDQFKYTVLKIIDNSKDGKVGNSKLILNASYSRDPSIYRRQIRSFKAWRFSDS